MNNISHNTTCSYGSFENSRPFTNIDPKGSGSHYHKKEPYSSLLKAPPWYPVHLLHHGGGHPGEDQDELGEHVGDAVQEVQPGILVRDVRYMGSSKTWGSLLGARMIDM